MKTTEEMIAVMQAYADGEKIDRRPHLLGDWKQISSGKYVHEFDFSRFDYRIAATQDSVDWSHVHKNYKWLARDENDLAWLFLDKPNVEGDFWYDGRVKVPFASSFSSYTRGTCDWKDSLVERPHV